MRNVFLSSLAAVIFALPANATGSDSRTTTEVFKDWQLSCLEKNAQKSCEIKSVLLNNTGDTVSIISLAIAEASAPVMQIVLPHFFDLTSSVKVNLQDDIVFDERFKFCDPRACYVVITDIVNDITVLSESSQGELEAVQLDGTIVKIPFSLEGFGLAYENLLATVQTHNQ
jgi:invasion protein IalB